MLVEDKVVGNNAITDIINRYTSKQITYWPAPIMTSSRRYWTSYDSTKLLVFDMTQEDFYEVEVYSNASSTIYVKSWCTKVLSKYPPL